MKPEGGRFFSGHLSALARYREYRKLSLVVRAAKQILFRAMNRVGGANPGRRTGVWHAGYNLLDAISSRRAGL
jgi:hypothetical protein